MLENKPSHSFLGGWIQLQEGNEVEVSLSVDVGVICLILFLLKNSIHLLILFSIDFLHYSVIKTRAVDLLPQGPMPLHL